MKCIKSDATELNPYKGKSEGEKAGEVGRGQILMVF